MTSSSYEMEPRHVEAFALIDLDRTLLNTPLLVDMLLLQLHDHGFTAEQVREHIQHIHSRAGKSLSLSEYFSAEFDNGGALFAVLKQEIIELAETEGLVDDLLYSGSKELLDALDEKTIPFAILTYGNVADQDFKLNLLRLLTKREVSRLHATVTDQPSKAKWVAENWDQGSGLAIPNDIYSTESLIAEYVVVIDDKIANLTSANTNVLGILMDNSSVSDRAMSIELLGAAVDAGESLVVLAQSQQALRA